MVSYNVRNLVIQKHCNSEKYLVRCDVYRRWNMNLNHTLKTTSYELQNVNLQRDFIFKYLCYLSMIYVSGKFFEWTY